MPVTIDTSFDLSNNNIKDFLVDESIEELALFDHTLQRTGPVATAPADYIHDPEQDVRNSDSPNTTYYEFLVEETYRVYQAQGVIGRVRATVKSLAELTIYSDFLMFLRSTLNEASRAHARALFANYDASQHGRNIYNYLEQNRNNALLTDDDYIVEPGLRLAKSYLDGSTANPNTGRPASNLPGARLVGYLIDDDASQRDRLFTEYNVPGASRDTMTRVDVITGADRDGEWGSPPITVILDEQNITLGQTPENRRIVESDSATISAHEHEVADLFTDKPGAVSAFIDGLVDATTGDVCKPSEMRRKDIRIMTIISYPEFRLIWRRKTITIGCARISFKYPVIQTRTAKRILFVHFSIPKKLGYTLFRIGESCAVRAVLAGAVIGIVLGNPAAAAASFESLFKACVKRELENCINAGLYILKETGPKWS